MSSVRPDAGAAGRLTIGGDLTVNRMGFGAMRITGRGIWGEPKNRGKAIALLRRAVELGVDFIDTADAYGPAVSENLIAEALHPYDGVVIATKGGLLRSGPGRWHPDCSPEHLRAACDASRARLRVECIDVYQLHTIDRRIPLEESVGALAELQRAGKIKHIGLSNVTVDQLARAQAIVPVVSVQNRYNLADRSSEDVVARCEEQEIAFIPWYPLGMGHLAETMGPLSSIAGERDVTSAQVALAWLLSRSSAMLPIPGTSSVRHLEENVAAAGISLTEEEMDHIERRRR